MGLLANVLRSMLPLVPRPIVERVAARYVAGSTLEDALRAVRTLNGEGACATVDILGESIEDESLVKRAVDDYLELIDAIQTSGVDSTVSVKPTMIGLGVGIDYALFIVTRHKLQLQAGMEVYESVARATATAGGAVVFAGTTVVIALCSLAFAGIPIVSRLGYMSGVAVLVAVSDGKRVRRRGRGRGRGGDS